MSAHYWTPLAVARRAAEWLDDLGVHTVTDIGSGAGKFCVAAALVGRCRFFGLEQYPFLVSAARALAELFDVSDRVSFIRGTLRDVQTLPVADAYYMFNPFGHYWFGTSEPAEPVAGAGGIASDVAAAERLLHGASIGTYLLTYNGFGGRVPRTYALIRSDCETPGTLRLWRKSWEHGDGQTNNAG